MADQTPQQLIKFSVCLYKKPSVDSDEFATWLTKTYAGKAMPIIKKHGIVQWAQTIAPPHFRPPFREALIHMNRPNWTVPDYDVVQSYWLKDITDMQRLTTDPEWLKLEEEAQFWADMDLGHFVVGHEFIMLSGGKGSASA
ncbi:hypothetical protein QBC38DRAFT_461320 [Podospora fimiseda]|uniref:EthD domain-containing protein n=1 Tax=Podospora fimiseda TaxID=252190 RepID=A0AAN6YLR2_9PEZI|nr:hypothetical protein QBC38DRAFT_461320 [Podospora fimiseda]